MSLTRNNNLVIVQEPAVLNMPRPSYMKTYGLGRIRKSMDNDVRLLVWAQQFRPLMIGGRKVFQSYCAYAGASVPIGFLARKKNVKNDEEELPVIDTGFPRSNGVQSLHVDHRIPNSAGGADNCWNFEGLCAELNMSPHKGSRITLHVMAEAFRRGETIMGMNFEPRWELFIWNFENYHEKNRATDIEMVNWWPFWLRHTSPPFRPFVPGYDEKRHEMYLSPKESLMEEWAILARNVCQYLRWCADTNCKKIVRETFEREYGYKPEEMAAAK